MFESELFEITMTMFDKLEKSTENPKKEEGEKDGE